jgi:2-oxoglutarate ferredoxin oxidoreductase subunit gamma
MSRKEIRVSGFGGQGVILCGIIIGMAASLYDKKHATLTQSFGPEARGGACSAQVVISDDRVLYPYIKSPDVLISMSQEAYEKFEPNLSSKGLLIVDEDLVKTKPMRDKIQVWKIPATRFAEQLGNKIVLNIVMLGFFTAIAELVNPDSAREAVKSSVPRGTVELNLKAFDKGYEFGVALKAGKTSTVTQQK